MRILQVVMIVAILNAATFILIRCWYNVTGRLSAKIVIPENSLAVKSDKTIFLSAGNLAQPEKAFEFLKPFLKNRRYAYLRFKMIGWSPLSTAVSILNAIGETGSAIICSISVGDHVSRYMEISPAWRRVTNYSINPCPARMAVKKGFRWLLTLLAPVFWILCHLLGWISVIPFIPGTGGRYSLMLLADQYMVIAFDSPPLDIKQTAGVILSDEDELLDNSYLQKYFAGIKPTWVHTHHGDTVGANKLYFAGFIRMLQEDKN